MMSVIWGDRVGLLPFEQALEEAAVERIYRWSRDEELLALSGGSPTELSLDEFRDRLRSEAALPSDDRRAFLIVTRNGEAIGRIGAFAIDWAHRTGELGIVIGEREYWGKRYGRDAILTLLRHLFQTTSLETVNLFTFPDNLRAQRAFAACGFREIGRGRQFSPDIGEYDGIEMQVTRREFLEPAARRAHKTSLRQEQR